MKFIHISDCHLGCWRNPVLQDLSVKAFDYALSTAVNEKADFVLITGDLFDTAMPSVDVLKEATLKLKELKDNHIPCYIVAGSHDYSVSGKTFLDVLENAGLFVNVARYEENEEEVKLELVKKDNIVLCGVPGKKAGLEIKIINKIKMDNIIGNELKILCLHTTLTEAKPKGMDVMESVDANKLPNGFDYYAFGHLHLYFNENINGKVCVYPGPLFPANFTEFEDLKFGSFCVVNWDGKINIEKKDINLKKVANIFIDANNKSPEQITLEIIDDLSKVNNCIITLKIKGTLARGKTSDINFNKINELSLKNNNILLKNTNALESQEFKAEVEAEGKDVDEIEKSVIEKYGKNEEFKEFLDIIENLMNSLETEKQEGETNPTFEQRIFDEINKVFGI